MVPRSSDQRLALVDRLTKRLSLLTDTDDIVMNFVATNHGDRSETLPFFDSLHKEAEGKMSKSKSQFSKQNHTSRICFRFCFQTYVNCLSSASDSKEKDSNDFTEQRSSTPKEVILVFYILKTTVSIVHQHFHTYCMCFFFLGNC